MHHSLSLSVGRPLPCSAPSARCRCSLYVKNLDESTRDEDLKEAFSEFGTVKAVHLLREQDGNLRGYGFIRFASPEEAAKALQLGQGRTVKGKQVFLAHAQRRNDMRNYANFQVESRGRR